MSALLNLFLNNLLPVFLAAGTGYLLSWWQPVNPRSISQVTFYIFSPCLVFTLLIDSQLSAGDIASVIAFSTLTFAVVGLAAWLLSRILRFERTVMAAVLLTSMLMNAGNFGLPVILFSFDDERTLAYASLYFVTMIILSYTAGVIIASLGKTGLREALLNLLKLPTLYALILAVILMRTGWSLPESVERSVSILGQAAIPASLVLLGIQFQKMRWNTKVLPIVLANGLRLVFAPAAALALSLVFSLNEPARQAVVAQAGMPAAVLTIVLATEYDVEPALVTATVFLTTLLSPLTLTPILAFLNG